MFNSKLSIKVLFDSIKIIGFSSTYASFFGIYNDYKMSAAFIFNLFYFYW